MQHKLFNSLDLKNNEYLISYNIIRLYSKFTRVIHIETVHKKKRVKIVNNVDYYEDDSDYYCINDDR